MTARSEYDNDDAQAKLARYVARGTEAMATVRALIEQLEAKGILNVADGAEVRQRAAEIDRELRDTP
jgi:signal transduction histidine kinase